MQDDRVLPIDRVAVLSFYDDPGPDENGTHATAINAVVGEEMGLALLIHCLHRRGVEAQILNAPCTTGQRRGHRLDGWVITPGVLYQVEVKNWSAHSLGGRRFPIGASETDSRRHRRMVWSEYWNGSTFTDSPAAKVIEPMRSPLKGIPVEPLIVFWVSLHPEGKPEPLFQVPLLDKAFDRVHIFSMSSYLRSLDDDTVDLPLPKATARLAILRRLFGLA
ncbi:MAG: hypothetical protein K1X65_11505 [Caldilineales bacterium]|nr:hypothetical protein [Caldilineales bacterium]MCW5858508.1 hypothetical protein [Caldilineales bacterium]